jgi:arylformamidase
MDFNRGDHLSLSSITTTLHLGAHADAPSHYHKEGKSIESCSLSRYLGPCQVLDVSHHTGELTLEKILPFDVLAERILFKTKSIKNVNLWQENFTYLSPELVGVLAKKGVKLIGIDTPSMDFSKSQELEAHQSFYKNDISILEGLELDEIKSGVYVLVALPLKIGGAEASPVRAVLLEMSKLYLDRP